MVSWRGLLCALAEDFLGLLLFASVAGAQTLQPVVVEYSGEAKGKFEIINDTLFPLNVVLEPKSFSVSVEGVPSFRPLDEDIHLRLTTAGFRVPPRQSYFVFYEARAKKLPAWFVIYCTFAGIPSQSGLNVQVELPHTVYLLQKKSLEKTQVTVSAEFDKDSREVLVELENTSPYLGRALGVDVRSKGHRASAGSFPLLPFGRRRLKVPWRADEVPEKVLLRFRGFTIQEELQAKRE
jgi:hypothetical protein